MKFSNMETDKKTGLGSSFLFQRTEPARPPSPLEGPAVLEVPAIPDGSTVQAPQTPKHSTAQHPARSTGSRPKKAQRLVLRDKRTLHIDRDVDERLTLAARIEGRERSEVVSDLLRKYLPRYRVERE